MSYYITYQEIPTELLQEILSKPNDEQFHDNLLENFNNEPNNALKYRRLFEGNIMIKFNEAELSFYKKTSTLFKLLRNYKIDSEVGIGTGMIESYQSPKQLEQTWNAIKDIQYHHPEYGLEVKFDKQETFSEYPSLWEDVIKFYYSCSLNKSAAIKLVG